MLYGTILSIDDTGLIVQLADGSSKIVMLTDSTQINQTNQSDKSALTVGETVNLFGTQNDDSSITAQTISMNKTITQDPLNIR